MAGKTTTKTFSGGMNKDLDFSLLKDDQYYDAQNYKLIADENANGFVLENAEGNSQWIDINLDVLGLDDTYKLAGHVYIHPYLVLFYTTNDQERTPTGGVSKIVRATVDKEIVQYTEVIYDDSTVTGTLGFSTAYPIKAVGHYETDDIIKIYWTDGYNDVKWMNIMDEDVDTYDTHMLDLTPNFPFDNSTSDTIRLDFNKYTHHNLR